MAVAAFQVVRDMIRRELLDSIGSRWTDDELDVYINIAQEVYARRTKVLKGEINIFHNGIDFIYQTPADYLEATSFVLDDSVKTNIPITSWKFIAERHSPKWLTDQSDQPKYIVFDYEVWNRFRLYPNTNKVADTLLGTLKYSRLPAADTLEINNLQTIMYYALFRAYLKERGGRYLFKAQKYKRLFESEFQKYKSRSTGTLKSKAAYRKVRTF